MAGAPSVSSGLTARETPVDAACAVAHRGDVDPADRYVSEFEAHNRARVIDRIYDVRLQRDATPVGSSEYAAADRSLEVLRLLLEQMRDYILTAPPEAD